MGASVKAVVTSGLPIVSTTPTPSNRPLTIVYQALGTQLRVKRSVYVVPGTGATTQPPTITLQFGNGDRDAVAVDGTRLGVVTTVMIGSAYVDPGVTAYDSEDGDLTSQVFACGVGNVDTSQPTAPERPYIITYQLLDGDGNAAATAYRFVAVVCPSDADLCPGDDFGRPSCSIVNVCGVRATELTATTEQYTQPSSSDPTTNVLDPASWSTPPQISLVGPSTVTMKTGVRYEPCIASSAPVSSTKVCEWGATAVYRPPGDPGTYDVTSKVVACAELAGSSERLPYAVVGLKYCKINTKNPGSYSVTFSVGYGGSGLAASATRTLVIQDACKAGESVCPNTGQCSQDGQCILPTNTETDGNSTLTPPGPYVIGGNSVVPSSGPPIIRLISTPVVGEVVTLRYGQTYVSCAAGQQPTPATPCEPGVMATTATGENITSRVLVCPSLNCATNDCSSSRLAVVGNLSAACGVAVFPQPQAVQYNTSLSSIMQWSYPDASYSVRFVVYDTEGGKAEVSRILQMVGPCGKGLYQCNSTLCSDVACGSSAALDIDLILRGALPGGGVANRAPVISAWLPAPDAVNGGGSDQIPVVQDDDANMTYWLAFGASHPLLYLEPCPHQLTVNSGANTTAQRSVENRTTGNGSGNVIASNGSASSTGNRSGNTTIANSSINTTASSSTAGDGSAQGTLSCAVMATDEEDGDLSSSITTQDVSPCDYANTTLPASVCHCSAAALMAGLCAPGRYTLKYSVVDSEGVVADPLVVRLYVERRLAYSFEVVAATSTLEQAAMMASLLNEDTPAGEAAALALVTRLSHLLLPGLNLSDLRQAFVMHARADMWLVTTQLGGDTHTAPTNTTAANTTTTVENNSTGAGNTTTSITTNSTTLAGGNITDATAGSNSIAGPSAATTNNTSSTGTPDNTTAVGPAPNTRLVPAIFLPITLVIRDITPADRDQLAAWEVDSPALADSWDAEAFPDAQISGGNDGSGVYGGDAGRSGGGSGAYGGGQSRSGSGSSGGYGGSGGSGGGYGGNGSGSGTVTYGGGGDGDNHTRYLSESAGVAASPHQRQHQRHQQQQLRLQRGLQSESGASSSSSSNTTAEGTSGTSGGGSSTPAGGASNDTTGGAGGNSSTTPGGATGSTSCGAYRPAAVFLQPPQDWAQTIVVPGLGNLTGLLRLPPNLTLAPACLTRELTLDDLLAGEALQQAAAVSAAVMQLAENLDSLQFHQWPEQDVTGVLDATDLGYGFNLSTLFSDAGTARAAILERLNVLSAVASEALSADNATLETAGDLATTQLAYLIATLSLSSVQATFLNTELVLNSLGYSVDVENPPEVQEHIDCVLGRINSPQYSFDMLRYSPDDVQADVPDDDGTADGSGEESAEESTDDPTDAPTDSSTTPTDTITTPTDATRRLLSGSDAGSSSGLDGGVDGVSPQAAGGVSAGGGPAAGTVQLKDWTGYALLSDPEVQYDLTKTAGITRRRILGVGSGNNLLGGLLLHQTRRSGSGSVCNSKYSHLDNSCLSTINTNQEEGSTSSVLLGDGITNTNEHNGSAAGRSRRDGGIGQDPVFNLQSQLYNADLKLADWYNTSQGSGEVDRAGVPYGFFHTPLKGYADGYPVWLSNGMSMARAQQMHVYLGDGGYLSTDYTSKMTLEGVVYNPQLSIFGLVQVELAWAYTGVIDLGVLATAIPAMMYQGRITLENWQMFVPTLLLALTSMLYIPLIVADLYLQLKAKRQVWQLQHSDSLAPPSYHPSGTLARQKSSGPTLDHHQRAAMTTLDGRPPATLDGRQGTLDQQAEDRAVQRRLGARRIKSLFWIVYEGMHCCVMLAALVLLFVYCFKLSVTVRLQDRFEVYDADAYAPARYLLSSRDASVLSLPTTTGGVDAALGVSSRPVPAAGNPDRWQVPAAPHNSLEDVAAMMLDVQTMWYIFAWYTFLQALVMLMLVVRMISLFTVQPRLRIIALTLGQALPDLVHLLIGPLLITVVMLGAALCIVYFQHDGDLSTISGAALVMGKLIINADSSQQLLNTLLQESAQTGNAAEVMLAGLMRTLAMVWVMVVMTIMIMSILLFYYSRLRKGMKNPATLWEDFISRLTWQYQVMKHRAPSNTHLAELLRLINRRASKPRLFRALHSLTAFKAKLAFVAGGTPPGSFARRGFYEPPGGGGMGQLGVGAPRGSASGVPRGSGSGGWGGQPPSSLRSSRDGGGSDDASSLGGDRDGRQSPGGVLLGRAGEGERQSYDGRGEEVGAAGSWLHGGTQPEVMWDAESADHGGIAARWFEQSIIYEEEEEGEQEEEEGSGAGSPPPVSFPGSPRSAANVTRVASQLAAVAQPPIVNGGGGGDKVPQPGRKTWREMLVVAVDWLTPDTPTQLHLWDGSGVDATTLVEAVEGLQRAQERGGDGAGAAPPVRRAAGGKAAVGACLQGQPDVQAVVQALLARVPQEPPEVEEKAGASAQRGRGAGAQRGGAVALLSVGQQAQHDAKEARERLQRRRQLLAMAQQVMSQQHLQQQQRRELRASPSINNNNAARGVLSPEVPATLMQGQRAASIRATPRDTSAKQHAYIPTDTAQEAGDVDPSQSIVLAPSSGRPPLYPGGPRAVPVTQAQRPSLLLQVRDGVVSLTPSSLGTIPSVGLAPSLPPPGGHPSAAATVPEPSRSSSASECSRGSADGGAAGPAAATGGRRETSDSQSDALLELVPAWTSRGQGSPRTSAQQLPGGAGHSPRTSAQQVPVGGVHSNSGNEPYMRMSSRGSGNVSRSSRSQLNQLHTLLSTTSRISGPAAARAAAAAAAAAAATASEAARGPGGMVMARSGASMRKGQDRVMKTQLSGGRSSVVVGVSQLVVNAGQLALTEEDEKELRAMMREQISRKHVQEWQMDSGPGFYESVRQQRRQLSRAVPTGRSFKLTAARAPVEAATSAEAAVPSRATGDEPTGAGDGQPETGVPASRSGFWTRNILRSSQRSSDPIRNATATGHGGMWDSFAAFLRIPTHLSARDAFEPEAAERTSAEKRATATHDAMPLQHGRDDVVVARVATAGSGRLSVDEEQGTISTRSSRSLAERGSVNLPPRSSPLHGLASMRAAQVSLRDSGSLSMDFDSVPSSPAGTSQRSSAERMAVRLPPRDSPTGWADMRAAAADAVAAGPATLDMRLQSQSSAPLSPADRPPVQLPPRGTSLGFASMRSAAAEAVAAGPGQLSPLDMPPPTSTMPSDSPRRLPVQLPPRGSPQGFAGMRAAAAAALNPTNMQADMADTALPSPAARMPVQLPPRGSPQGFAGMRAAAAAALNPTNMQADMADTALPSPATRMPVQLPPRGSPEGFAGMRAAAAAALNPTNMQADMADTALPSPAARMPVQLPPRGSPQGFAGMRAAAAAALNPTNMQADMADTALPGPGARMPVQLPPRGSPQGFAGMRAAAAAALNPADMQPDMADTALPSPGARMRVQLPPRGSPQGLASMRAAAAAAAQTPLHMASDVADTAQHSPATRMAVQLPARGSPLGFAGMRAAAAAAAAAAGPAELAAAGAATAPPPTHTPRAARGRAVLLRPEQDSSDSDYELSMPPIAYTTSSQAVGQEAEGQLALPPATDRASSPAVRQGTEGQSAPPSAACDPDAVQRLPASHSTAAVAQQGSEGHLGWPAGRQGAVEEEPLVSIRGVHKHLPHLSVRAGHEHLPHPPRLSSSGTLRPVEQALSLPTATIAPTSPASTFVVPKLPTTREHASEIHPTPIPRHASEIQPLPASGPGAGKTHLGLGDVVPGAAEVTGGSGGGRAVAASSGGGMGVAGVAGGSRGRVDVAGGSSVGAAGGSMGVAGVTGGSGSGVTTQSVLRATLALVDQSEALMRQMRDMRHNLDTMSQSLATRAPGAPAGSSGAPAGPFAPPAEG